MISDFDPIDHNNKRQMLVSILRILIGCAGHICMNKEWQIFWRVQKGYEHLSKLPRAARLMLLVSEVCWQVEGWRGTARAGRGSHHLASPRAIHCPHYTSLLRVQDNRRGHGSTFMVVQRNSRSEESEYYKPQSDRSQSSSWSDFIHPAGPWLGLPSPPNILAAS